LAIGYVGVRWLMSINPGNIPRIGVKGSAVSLDGFVIAFTLAVSVVTGILFGLLPAFTASRTRVSAAFNAGGARSGQSVSNKRTHSALVVTEVALAFVLLVGSALMIRSLHTLLTLDPGFDASDVLTMEMSLTGSRYQTTREVAQLIDEAQRRVEALPNVVALAATFSLPLEHRFGGLLTLEAQPDNTFGADACYVSQKYFEVFGIPILRGRAFQDGDRELSSPVMLINQQMTNNANGSFAWSAPLVWPGGEPIGQRLTMGKNMGPLEDYTREIIGVVGNVRDVRLETPPQPNVYIPISQLKDDRTRHTSGSPIAWAIRTKTDPWSLLADVERELRTASGGLPVGNIRTMRQVMVASTRRTSFHMTLLSIFACVALILAATGIYSVLAYSVQQRKQEIGIRIALGARPLDVRRMVVQQGLLLATAGVGFGIAGSLLLSGLMKSMLFGVEESDPLVLTTVAILLTAVAVLAVYLPAREATQVNPVVALRWE
jgi:predicted permease